MKRILSIAALVTSLLIASPAISAEQTVKLAVANITCVSCVPIVKRTLSAVPGVTMVVVSAQTASAVVTFDDQKTKPEALIAAVTNAGYPTKLAAATTPVTQ
jgi:mercuric ion binding protein